jgi:molybdenum cofactor cytidylyltransferase
LGHPKQLVRYRGKTLLQHTMDVLEQDFFHPKIVVLGANDATIRKDLKTQSFQLITNPDWAEGMASSLKQGLKHALKLSPKLDAILVSVSDQPAIDVTLFTEIIKMYSRGAKIVASKYQDIAGVPVLFDRQFFTSILKLSGDQGAKSIMKANADQVQSVDFDLGWLDIDTPKDIETLNQLDG